MSQRIFLLFLMFFMLQISSAMVEQLSLTSMKEKPEEKSNLNNSNESLAEQPGIIALIVLICFNVFIFMIVCCCLCKRRDGFRIDLSQARQQLNERYPQIKFFKTKTHYCKESEEIESERIFFRYDTITELPAFIYGD